MPYPLAVPVLVVGGVVAGVVGTAGGITSMVSYPALLVTGLSPFAANVANMVALVASWPASAAVSTSEISEQRAWLARGLPAAVVGGALGSALLLTTPSRVFDRIVPVLIALGAVALLAQPWLTARADRVRGSGRAAFSLVASGVICIYGGYFGAGSGVMLLVMALVLVDARMPVANAVKNMLVGAAVVASAALLVAVEPVRWSAVVPLACGTFAGSLCGPIIARRLPARLVRWLVAALGLTLAVVLAIAAT
jgi:uncharacterized membrane protein YfcA